MPAATPNLFSGAEIVALLEAAAFTHVVWVPDSSFGPWEAALEASGRLALLRVAREGEAWPLAAGLHIGGRRPLIVMQCTGLFDSGDALRNALFDMRLPLLAIIGVRNLLNPESGDTARRFAQPVAAAWGVDQCVIASEADKPQLADFLARQTAAGQAGLVLLAEGAG